MEFYSFSAVLDRWIVELQNLAGKLKKYTRYE
jgi:hypothetical protein